MQLDAFLRSYEAHVEPTEAVDALYMATTERHRRAYEEVFALHRWAVRPHAQTHSFYHDLLRLLPERGYAVMFADDHLFLRAWCAEEIEINLHMGLNLTHCYTRGVPQEVPPFVLVEPDKASWRWSDGQHDWGYPLAACGQVFDMREMRPMIAGLAFHSPNSLEAALQSRVSQFRDRTALCYRQSKLVLLPWNLVQTDCVNRAAQGLPGVEQLLAAWEQGMRIEIEPLFDVVNESVHQELPLVLEAR